MANAGLKVWNGSAWVFADPKHYNGASWDRTVGRVYNGASWDRIWPPVTLSGEAISDGTLADPITSRTATAGVRVRSNGTVEALVNTTWSPIDVATDWIYPNAAAADATYHVRITNVVWTRGSSFTTEAAAEDTWLQITGDHEWTVQDAIAIGAGNKYVAFDLQISDDAGATVLATGSYS